MGKLKGSTIVVTGASGTIAKYVIKRLLKEQPKVMYLLVRSLPVQVPKPPCKYVLWNTVYDKINTCDYVFHLAVNNNYNLSLEEAKQNIQLVKLLCEFAQHVKNIQGIVMLSTVYLQQGFVLDTKIPSTHVAQGNIYIKSRCLMEQLFTSMEQRLSLGIVRAPIICPDDKEIDFIAQNSPLMYASLVKSGVKLCMQESSKRLYFTTAPSVADELIRIVQECKTGQTTVSNILGTSLSLSQLAKIGRQLNSFVLPLPEPVYPICNYFIDTLPSKLSEHLLMYINVPTYLTDNMQEMDTLVSEYASEGPPAIQHHSIPEIPNIEQQMIHWMTNIQYVHNYIYLVILIRWILFFIALSFIHFSY